MQLADSIYPRFETRTSFSLFFLSFTPVQETVTPVNLRVHLQQNVLVSLSSFDRNMIAHLFTDKC